MFTLLPEQDQVNLKKEYTRRLLIVALCFFSVAIIISSVFLLPTYIASRITEQQIKSKRDEVATYVQKEEEKKLTEKLVSYNTQATLMTPAENSFYKVTQHIISLKSEQITINDFSVTSNTDNSTIIILGRAQTRNSLKEFAHQLETDPLFSSVDLPVSSLAKDTNLNFSIGLKLKGSF